MIQLLSKIAKKGNSAFNVAVTFFLFAGSMAVLAYFIQSAKYIFIFWGILIYCFSFIFRKIIFNKENKTHYSELAYFFISFLFLGYLLDLLKLDKNIKNYFIHSTTHLKTFTVLFHLQNARFNRILINTSALLTSVL